MKNKLFLYILILLVSLSACSKGERKEGLKKKGGKWKNHQWGGRNRKKEAKIIQVYITNIIQTLDESGKVAPKKDVQIKSRISGRVTAIKVEEGDYVKKGQIIAIIKPDLSQAKIISAIMDKLNRSKIQLDNKQKNFDRKKELMEKGFISENEFDTAEDELFEAQMDYENALKEYKLFKEEIGGVKTISSDQELSIISPLNGVVLEQKVEEGEIITGESSTRGGSVLFNIADVSRLIIKININEVDIYKISKGNKVDINIAANPNKKYTGIVKKIAPKASTVKGVEVFPTEIEIIQKDKRLRPGMSATIRLYLKARENVLAVPVTAVFVDKEQDYVLAPKKKGGLKRINIKRGINDEYNVEIISGLKKGDRIYSDIPVKELMKEGSYIPSYKKRKDF